MITNYKYKKLLDPLKFDNYDTLIIIYNYIDRLLQDLQNDDQAILLAAMEEG